MTDTMHLLATMVQRHAHLALPSNADSAALPASPQPHDLAYACARRLGFIHADAACVAQAWARQSQRTGHFDPSAWPIEIADFTTMPQGPAHRFPACPQALGVYAVLPSAEWVARMAQAGVPTLQLRFKSNDRAAVAAEIGAAVRAVEGTTSRLFINDHWQLALESGAYGVHLGQEDLDLLTPEQLHTIRQAGLRLGLSTHGYAEMLRAHAVGPSYIALGAVFPTTLKAMATPPQGLGRLSVYAQMLRNQPLVAIGGISPEHLAAIARTGVGAFAVVRAITAAPNPEEAAAELQRLWQAARKEKPT
jgi:thiamine-phosphate pyrophosphorylase